MLSFSFAYQQLAAQHKLAWHPSSWQSAGKKYQMPVYKNQKELVEVKQKLSTCAPLVFAGECRDLSKQLALASIGNGFVIMGGDCAESFDDFSVEKIKSDFQLMLQMALILTYGASTSITKIGRIAGQFAKPRSNNFEIIDNKQVPVYRGDIINSIKIDNREPDPVRLLQAYYQSAQTLNLLRAFANGGYADISMIHMWNSNFAKDYAEFESLVSLVEKSIKFIKAIGIDVSSPRMKQVSYYTAHEALALDYEEPLTRIDSITNTYYDCSAHMLWLGERTRQIDSSHIEFLSGVSNPIGIKISEKFNKNEIINIIERLNPENLPGKICLITRMGCENLKQRLPELVRTIKDSGKNVLWICDPMHANTFETNGKKTRSIRSIKDELNAFFDIHEIMGTIPGGIHLEMTSENVTECLGGIFDDVSTGDLNNNYQSLCDPRLNGKQALEIAFFLAGKMNKRIK
jgi:3-deoxy-7-phosphoheptulonate synthase